MNTTVVLRRLLCVLAIVASPGIAAQERPLATAQPLDPVLLETFVDGVWLGQQSAHALAGAVVTVVQNNEVLLSKGYGFADAEARTPVDPDQTLFRIASISKPFTWIAVMQLVEEGKIDLDADVNEYVDFDVLPRAVGPSPCAT